MPHSFVLQYAHPWSVSQGVERRSKLLDPHSALYKCLMKCRYALIEKYGDMVGPARMDLHTELIKSSELPTDELLLARTAALHNKHVNLEFVMVGSRAFCAKTPAVDGYGSTHVTIAYFGGVVPAFGEMNDMCLKCADVYLYPGIECESDEKQNHASL